LRTRALDEIARCSTRGTREIVSPMGAFLIRRFAYLLALVVIATSAAYALAATQLNPRSRYEGRNPPPPEAVVDAALDAVNMNDKTPLSTRFERWATGVLRGDLGQTVG